MMLLDEDANMGCPSKPVKVKEVWVDNLETEFELIRGLADEYPFVFMNTEFPDVVFKPQPSASLDHPSKKKPQLSDHYKYLKANVDLLKLIQLWLTLSDASRNLSDRTTMKFPFHFRVGRLIVVLGDRKDDT